MGIGDFQFMTGRVMHKRLLPKINAFNYGIYYIALPLKTLTDMPISYNKFGLMSFFDKDHGSRDGSDLEVWAHKILTQGGLKKFDGDITLVTMPRIFGYVFNPVSYWLCHDINKNLIAYLCEVNNTFGETHTYICMHDDHRPIKPTDVLKGEKTFHVSPFLKREGEYFFSIDSSHNDFKSHIDFYNAENKKQLVTKLYGQYEPMSKKNVGIMLLTYPLVTIKAISLIHWQALKLIAKGISYIPKPIQKKKHVTKTK